MLGPYWNNCKSRTEVATVMLTNRPSLGAAGQTPYGFQFISSVIGVELDSTAHH